jgi:hypothetical protein
MYNEFGKKPKFTLVTVIAVAAVMLVAATTEMAITGYAFAYNRNQATSAANDCGNGQEPTNIGCQNTDSQIQGDENSVALISQQTFPSEPPQETATLIVIKEVECVEGEECPSLPEPSEFTLSVVPEGGAAIPVGQDPAFGEPIPIPPGDYQISEDLTPPNVDGLDFVNVSPDNGCDSGTSGGSIQAGEERTCIFTNNYAPEPTGFTVEGTGAITQLQVLCIGLPASPPLNFNLEFSAQSDGTVSGTYTMTASGVFNFVTEGVFTDGTTDGSIFSLTGEGITICPDPDSPTVEVTVSGDCGDDVTMVYREPQNLFQTTLTGNVECTLT